MTSVKHRSQGERAALLTQAAAWKTTVSKKDEQLALMRQQAQELYRCIEDRQQRLDRALTAELHMQLERSALEVRTNGLCCALVSLCGYVHCILQSCYNQEAGSQKNSPCSSSTLYTPPRLYS